MRRLSDLGWIESQNLVLEQRWVEGRNDRLLALAAELVQQVVDELLDAWTGIGLIVAGMTHQGWDMQLTAYAARNWRADFFPVGIAHSVVAGSHGRS